MKTINLIITGGIAASKSRKVYDLLAQKYQVNVIVSENAKRFVKLDDINYIDKIFDQDYYENHTFGEHIKLAFGAELNVVYPASYSYIGKIANGLAGDISSLLFAASKAPFLLFPSMNFNMYANPILHANKEKLLNIANVRWIEPKVGKMASGHVGIGRALEPEEVDEIVGQYFKDYVKFNDKKVVLNFGRTRSYIDKVRYITNESSGKMGMSIRDNLKGHVKELVNIFGDTDVVNVEDELNIHCKTNQDMLEAMKTHFDDANIVICVAALYDFEVENKVDHKIEKREQHELSINLKGSIDVLKELGKIKKNQYLVGFSLANEFDLEKAWTKATEKNVDMLIVNLTSAMGDNFNQVKVLTVKDKKVIDIPYDNKNNVSAEILRLIHEAI
ncbi:bifunctional phosphopantothenoylcysteine decarboxylase/phosphopantothenate--cysteine ligase CoaBC [Spiroplasma culicicola]|uniref:Coenzyme A biosynthesis bifunctional protein CoaBC n=1 Tax=Spiroplasma culicicola AES-1 TaxID=1276246 RepID=W6A795_9MOLU|nr:bifunctional phosphopantothenoylcysteine decarboxylase/phosphopantothenate--cysteine ligase CoaBC [Spiroplasma culicicola]AHI52867.1 pantothenate metabolism flavoprotein [Spiroplasma culicicola AES-1]